MLAVWIFAVVQRFLRPAELVVLHLSLACFPLNWIVCGCILSDDPLVLAIPSAPIRGVKVASGWLSTAFSCAVPSFAPNIINLR